MSATFLLGIRVLEPKTSLITKTKKEDIIIIIITADYQCQQLTIVDIQI